jgi:hypothetical protein
MARIRIHVKDAAHRPREPIELEIEVGVSAGQVLSQALERLRDLPKGPDSEDPEEEGEEGRRWRLRARRITEEGRWWTEAEVDSFKDRTSISTPPEVGCTEIHSCPRR